MENLIFFLFKILILLTSLMVISAKNPVHSILFLVIVFVNATGILLLLKVEFLALIFLVVYVGAIAVLFLFVVMMLNIRMIELSEKFLNYFPISGIIGLLLISEIIILLGNNFSSFTFNNLNIEWIEITYYLSNIESLGNTLYTYEFLPFLISGIVLLVAIIGSIVLTLHHRVDVERQKIYLQLSKSFEKIIFKEK